MLHNMGARGHNRTRSRKISPSAISRRGWFAANNIINVMSGAIWLFSLCKFNWQFAPYSRVCACACVCVYMYIYCIYTYACVQILRMQVADPLSVGNVTTCTVSAVYFVTRRMKAAISPDKKLLLRNKRVAMLSTRCFDASLLNETTRVPLTLRDFEIRLFGKRDRVLSHWYVHVCV